MPATRASVAPSSASRPRQSTATPAPSRTRHSTAAATTPAPAAATGNTPAPPRSANFPLPEYEPPTAALTRNAQDSLNAILNRTYPVSKVTDHLKRAATALEESTSEVNERLTEREVIVKRRKAKRAKQEQQRRNRQQDGDDEADNAIEDAGPVASSQGEEDKENEDLEAMRIKVEAMTSRLDGAMRKCVDSEAGLDSLEKSMREVVQSAVLGAQAQDRAQKQQQTQQTQQTQQRSTGGAGAPDATPEVTQPGATAQGTTSQQQEAPEIPDPPQLTPAFTSALEGHTDAYAALSLRARYSEHPQYVSFRKLTWDAQHPDDEIPPMPHASTWFVKEEAAIKRQGSPAPGVTGGATQANRQAAEASGSAPGEREADDDEDDDIAVARVRVSTKCPITLVEFVNPVSSTKCSHSFEREAILSMMAAHKPQRVKCPVAGCDRELGRADLVDDKVTLRRIKRMQRAREMGSTMGLGAGVGSDDVQGDAVDVDGEGDDGNHGASEESGEDIDDVQGDDADEIEDDDDDDDATQERGRAASDEIEDD